MQSAEELAYSLDATDFTETELEHSIKYTLIFETSRQLNKAVRILQQNKYPAYRSSPMNNKDEYHEVTILMKIGGDKPDSNDRDLLRSNPVGSTSSQQNHTDSRFARSTPDIVREVPEGFYHIKPSPLGDIVILYNIWGELKREVVPVNLLRDKIIELKQLELRNVDEHPIPKRKSGTKQKLDSLEDDSWIEKAMVNLR